MSTTIGFYLIGLIAALAALMTVLSRNLFHAVLSFAVTSLAIAGLMLTVSAEFLAFVVILVYVGAVVVVAVFAVMLTGKFEQPTLPQSNDLKSLAAVTVLALAGIITGVVLLQPPLLAVAPNAVTIKTIGELLLTQYVLPFELVSILLLAVLIGSIVIAKGRED